MVHQALDVLLRVTDSQTYDDHNNDDDSDNVLNDYDDNISSSSSITSSSSRSISSFCLNRDYVLNQLM